MTQSATLTVRVKPGAKKPGIERGNPVVVRVRARPVENAANEAVREALPTALDVPPSAVALIRGATSREKTFAIAGRSAEAVTAWAAALPALPAKTT